MSRLWPKRLRFDARRLRVGLCPDRLVCADAIRHAAELEALAREAGLTVILSNHFVRYAVLPWSDELKTGGEWLGYAQHHFASVYGNAASDWRIRICDAGARKARVACAVDAALLERLRATPGVVSVQPHLMAAFNRARRAVNGKPQWFAIQEQGRLTVSLIENGEWKLIRNRQANGNWRELMPEIMDREESGCEEALLCAEEEAPSQLGRYRVTVLRSDPRAMALH